jgi:FAD/FMN-containing dehydrogenase
MALANQGDVDVQALAGAVSTGTHGTGRSLGSLSTQVVGLRLVNAAGEIVNCSVDEEADLFSAARVSLGTLGVVTALRMRLVPAYRLHEHTWQEPIDTCLDRLAERIAGNRHFEFFWYQATDLAHAKALNPTEAEPGELPNLAGQRIDHSDRIFPTVRSNRFNEMEYSVPYDAGPSCFREIRALMRERHPDVAWPVEYRTLAADDIDLSTAQGRETVTLSIHQAAALDPRAFFAAAEAIFRAHGGRPHWAKMHSLLADQLAPLYPRWNSFHTVRRRLDPGRVFTNDYLERVFGE